MKDMSVAELKAGILLHAGIGDHQSTVQFMQEFLNRGAFTVDQKSIGDFWLQVRVASSVDPETGVSNPGAFTAFFKKLDARDPADTKIDTFDNPGAHAPVADDFTWQPGLS